MSVPLDRLYDFINGLCNQDLIIYRWWPHGSKKLNDLSPLKIHEFNGNVVSFNDFLTPQMICHDQEPLDYDLYSPENNLTALEEHFSFKVASYQPDIDNDWWTTRLKFKSNLHLKSMLSLNIHDNVLLLHSEQNSNDVVKFKRDGFVPVYYWSHALIALDWFRYAKHTTKFNFKQPKKDFLIYNRAWSGTREYRLKFSELLVENNLINNISMNFSKIDNGVDYQNYSFKNKNFQIGQTNLELFFAKNKSVSSASGDFEIDDYCDHWIEVVLETVFDDTKHHLTEKTLRPIACKQPFILAATPGSLEYLKKYGFKTFDSLWDESYDLIEDPVKRLEAIVNLMNTLANMPASDKEILNQQAKKICDYNHDRFFSDEFFNDIISEYKTNIDLGLSVVDKGSKGKNFLRELNLFKEFDRKLYPAVITYETYQQIKHLKF